MRRIDIFGVPGSGKTTIYKALRKKKKTANWYTADEALRNIYRRHFKKNSYDIEDYFYFFTSLFFSLKSLVPISKEAYKDFISEHIDSKNPVFEHYFETIQKETCTSPYIKARRMEFLVNAVEEIVILEHFLEEDVIVFDESLTAKLFLFVLKTSDSSIDELAFKLRKLFPPDGYIFLDAEPEEIKKRIASRNRLTTQHSGLTKAEINEDIDSTRKKYQLGHQVLNKLGVKGTVINTNNHPSEVLSKVEYYLNSF